ncbi:MAG: helix-turn-helix transcriptional regulator [Bacteroidota bacterium]|nr:helix-turn-helix transcriptional regulator [Bacteroidota bacterium]MDP3144278.1 helix-turn-helix transcriptional regulator [Bacteroidota bacterium]
MIYFSKRLKEILKEKDVSIKDFAKMIGLSEIGLHNALKNNSTKLETIELIAKNLGTTPSYFLKSDEELKNSVSIEEYNRMARIMASYLGLVNCAIANGTETWRFFNAVHNKTFALKNYREAEDKISDIIDELRFKHELLIEKVNSISDDQKLRETILKYVPKDEIESFMKVNGKKISYPGIEKHLKKK